MCFKFRIFSILVLGRLLGNIPIMICNGVSATLVSYVWSRVLSYSEQLNIAPLFQAGKTLSVRKWQAAFNPDGCLDIASVLSRIQKGVRFLNLEFSLSFKIRYVGRCLLICIVIGKVNNLKIINGLFCSFRVFTRLSGGRFGSSYLAALIRGVPSMRGRRSGK